MRQEVLTLLKSIEIYIFSLPLAAQWLPIDTLEDEQSSGACALSTLLLCVSVHKLNNKHALKTSWEPSTTARRCFHKGYRSSWVKPHFSVCRRLDALAPLQILTTKCPFDQNMQIPPKKTFKRWVGRIWRCCNWTYWTGGWKWLISLARSFAPLANQQKFVALFPGRKLHQLLMVGRVGIYIIPFQAIWTPQDNFLKNDGDWNSYKITNITGFWFQAVPGNTNAFSIQITPE